MHSISLPQALFSHALSAFCCQLHDSDDVLLPITIEWQQTQCPFQVIIEFLSEPINDVSCSSNTNHRITSLLPFLFHVKERHGESWGLTAGSNLQASIPSLSCHAMVKSSKNIVIRSVYFLRTSLLRQIRPYTLICFI